MKKILIYLQITFIKLFFPKYWFLPSSLVYAQARHETGKFSSPVYKQNKNLFGMRENSRSYDIGTNLNHAIYESRIDSIIDYFLRQKQFKISFSSVDDFINQTLKSNYAEDKLYKSKWLSHYNEVKNLRFISYILTPSIPLAIWLIIKKLI